MRNKRKSKNIIVSKGGLITGIRKTCRFGNSIYIALPREWLEKQGIAEGEEVSLVANSVLKVIPMKGVE